MREAYHLYPNGRRYPAVSVHSATMLCDDLVTLLERLPEWRERIEYNPVTREIRVRYQGCWHVVTVREE